MKVLIDNGHGVETPGKRSPDGRLREYAYTREIADRVISRLQAEDIDAIRIVPEKEDISLQERVARANKYYAESGKQTILVSIHCNAAGDGSKWMRARGWSVFIDPTASADSKRLATAMADVAEEKGVTVRKETGDRNYWIANLYICKHTNCPAVLVENFFQDNEKDVDFLLSEEGKQCVTDIIVEGIKKYLTGK
ncbi:N-acetylmuramoyl-L-alanine amidase [Bacteroides fragilis]|uniref:N-acetylmuramoyl-L-alanine amidase n=1 Tax=Bacteroides fragilis TaxID=817 RepID=A0A853PSP3_BACFG|nr:N-acetylmuramoyl-L-alanine amidase [Bacteroides fragilis]MCS2359401.1 N-acetylmuramoyl-L-alanine amidase [Bacteroides fragilis]OCR29028.1 N-acetylmuramoyl-L-alanine amidase [Bacteroides fragilis]PJY65807.1 putative N-acetylmuramoyl-L-alanine amidase, LytC precursor-like [Bacteroides fragilis]